MTRFASIVLLTLFALVACDSDSDNNANNDGSLAGNAGKASASGGATSAGRGGATTAIGGATTTSGGRSGSGGTTSTTTDCGGLAGLACGTGQFCNYALDAQCGAADQMGTCTAMPDACTMEYAPVCGCDGKTYGNSCSAHSAGVSVASEGACSN